MVQKSGEKTTVWMVLKPILNNGMTQTTFPSTGDRRISEPSTVSYNKEIVPDKDFSNLPNSLKCISAL